MRTKKWSENQLRAACQNATSIRQLLIQIGLREAGGNYKQISKYIKLYNIDVSHFRGRAWNKGLTGISKPRVPLEKILIAKSTYQSFKLKRRLIKLGLKQEKCELCGWAEVAQDGRIPVELDHINGDNQDNRITNLRILCPNCHSLQSTHRGKNIKI